MRRTLLTGLLALWMAGCSTSGAGTTASSITSGTSGAGTTATSTSGSTVAGATTTTTSSTSTSSGTTTSTTSTSSSGTTMGTASTTGSSASGYIVHCQGGETCQLEDGGNGVCCGEGTNPEICKVLFDDPANCGTCAEACLTGGTCIQGSCAYQTCNGQNDLGNCPLQDGGSGFCCRSSCEAIDFMADPNNCGGCGIVCPDGMCGSGCCANGCASGCSAGQTCSNVDFVSMSCGGQVSKGCFPSTCAGLADGATCALQSGPAAGEAGLCCGQTCVEPDGTTNCGGCGIICPSGTTCQPGLMQTYFSCF